jgi:hypothetical protein
MELLLIGRMIALDLATLSSLSLSMADDLSINQILRLRGNAVRLARAGERCRAALPGQKPTGLGVPLSGSERADATPAQAQSAPATSMHPPAPKPVPPQADLDFPPGLPDSIDTMKAAMARIASEPERHVREAAMNDTPTIPATQAEEIIHSALAYVLPKAAPPQA